MLDASNEGSAHTLKLKSAPKFKLPYIDTFFVIISSFKSSGQVSLIRIGSHYDHGKKAAVYGCNISFSTMRISGFDIKILLKPSICIDILGISIIAF